MINIKNYLYSNYDSLREKILLFLKLKKSALNDVTPVLAVSFVFSYLLEFLFYKINNFILRVDKN